VKRAAIALASALLLVPSLAFADPTPADRALATELFERGRALLAEGKTTEACAQFGESQRLDPSPGTLLNLANCHEQEGKTATAWSEFNEALAVAERSGQADRVAFAKRHIDALVPRLARLVIVIPPELDAPDLEIARDGSPLAHVVVGTEMPIDPGSHAIVVKRRGFEPWTTTVTIGDGERNEILVGPLVAEPAPAPEPVPVVMPPPAPPPSTERPSRSPLVPIVLAGVGALGLVAGGVSGIVAIDANTRSDHRCAPRCDDEGYSLNRTAKTAADVSTVSFAVGAASLGTAIVLYLASGSPAIRF
jgi:hypothetical protein